MSLFLSTVRVLSIVTMSNSAKTAETEPTSGIMPASIHSDQNECPSLPCIRPLNLAMIAVTGDVTKQGDIVLDPFSGSGTTIIAAEKTGRIARTVEINPHYCDVAIRRWEEFTGKSASLAETSENFESFCEQQAKTCLCKEPENSRSAYTSTEGTDNALSVQIRMLTTRWVTDGHRESINSKKASHPQTPKETTGIAKAQSG